jgi:hypothetical protein
VQPCSQAGSANSVLTVDDPMTIPAPKLERPVWCVLHAGNPQATYFVSDEAIGNAWDSKLSVSIAATMRGEFVSGWDVQHPCNCYRLWLLIGGMTPAFGIAVEASG